MSLAPVQSVEDLPYSADEIREELARRKHLRFVQHCWRDENRPFLIGFHTQRICDRLDQAFNDYRDGKSSYIAMAVHHRSGKSEIVAGNLAPHFLGEFPGREVMYVSYQANIAQRWGRKARSLVESKEFRELYPRVSLSQDSQAANRWEISLDGRSTRTGYAASGLSSGITGTGAHLAILDDYLAGRRQAESPVTRDNAWASFTNDFMTRLAPIHIVVILATWWHFDDIRGRIVNMTDPESDDYDPAFPKFEFLDFPARAEDWINSQEDAGIEEPEPYPGEYLFDHVFDEKTGNWVTSPKDWFRADWYEKQYATLGEYSAAGIMNCNPIPKTGNLLEVDKVVVHETLESIPLEIRKELKWNRVWDYAHTAKQRTGDDPDFTGGTLLAFRRLGYNKDLQEYMWELWVRDYREIRAAAPERDEFVRATARQDGPTVRVLGENSLDSKDAIQYLQKALHGLRVVTEVNCPGDKVTRITPVEPVFAAGNAHIIRGAWNRTWRTKLRQFDGSGKTHDEPVDNISCAYKQICIGSGYRRLRDPMS
jgi:predicted phage terminase large subunit-like protein